ncbi:MAG: HAMP domain-containing histidine kinase [Ruminococcaceae bacterium]|nr:HAMP domain-containing histidine kinase [Oscillospiraceae bacterium]
MTKLKKSFALKLITFFLASVLIFGFIFTAFGTVIIMKYDVYTEDREKVLGESLENIAFEYAWKIGLSASDYLVYDNGTVYAEAHAAKSLVPHLEDTYSSVYFEVTLPDGTVLLSNYAEESFRMQVECIDRVSVRNETGKIVISSDNSVYYDTTAGADTEEETASDPDPDTTGFTESESSLYSDKKEPHEEAFESTEAPEVCDRDYYGDEPEMLTEIRTKVYVKEEFKHFDKMYFAEKLVGLMYSVRFIFPVLALILFFTSAVSVVFLLYTAGYKKGSDEPACGVFDRIPFDVLTAAYVCIAGLEFIFFGEFVSELQIAPAIILGAIAAYADILLILAYLYTFTVRCKTGTLLKNTVIYKVFRYFYRLLRKLFVFFREILIGLPVVWKSALAIAAVLAAELIAFFLCILWQAELGWLIFWWFIENLFLIPLILYFVIQMKKLKTGCREISSGNLSYKIDTSGMPQELREHGENLNSIRDGMAAAVEEKLKSERLKTELITNVSHDIKTPLTSIINYVDLLKKEEPENEKSREYLEVLERQCSRLKKLIYDLVEASKASTGNVKVNLSPIEGGVLLGQVLGEYETRINEAELELVLIKPEYPIYFTGDGNLMWRVLDNLMNNICKYAQPGTRVYVSLEDFGDSVKFIFKNVSKYQLNISEDELMERFVRADSSRSTEGSGLGLSIARSLTGLQKGELSILVDGDLFKATVEMKK